MPAPRACEARMSCPGLCKLCTRPLMLSAAATAVAVNLRETAALRPMRGWAAIDQAAGWHRMELVDGP